MGVGSQGNTECPGETEISQLQVALDVNQQILRLQITVQDAVAVAVANALYQLSHESLNHSFTETQVGTHHRTIRKSLSTATLADGQSLHVFLQVEVKVFEDEVELMAVGVDNVQQLYNIGVLHLFEEGDLANGGTWDTLIFGFETDLLESDDTIGMVELAGLVDNTVGTYEDEMTRELGINKANLGGIDRATQSRQSHVPSPIFSIFW